MPEVWVFERLPIDPLPDLKSAALADTAEGAVVGRSLEAIRDLAWAFQNNCDDNERDLK
jgi:hypothetical protein